MESLESKLDRLSPAQRREAEDFVDFLLSRSEEVNISRIPSGNLPPVMHLAPQSLPTVESMHTEESRPAGMPPARNDVSSGLFQEIGGCMDPATRDYMDYGQFEKPSLQGSEAAEKVRRKIVEKERQGEPHYILDWVD